MAKSKKRNILTMAIIVAVLIIVAFIMVLVFTNRNSASDKNNKLKMSGSYYDNISDFSNDIGNEKSISLSMEYLKKISYEIIEIDNEKMLATLIISVPDISDTLPTIVDRVIADNKDVDYEELLSLVKESMEEAFNSSTLTKKEASIQLSVENENGSYKLIPNDEWDKLIIGNIEDMYIEYLKILVEGMSNEVPKQIQ